jgi:hypothetical protein
MWFIKRLFEGIGIILLAIWLLAVIRNLIRRLCWAIREWWWLVDLSPSIRRAIRAMKRWWFWRRQSIKYSFERRKAG